MDRKERYKRKTEMERLRFDEGWSYKEIGDKFRVSRQRVDQIIGKSGFTSSRASVKAKKLVREYDYLYPKEIAKITGIKASHLHNARVSLGISVNKEKRFWTRVDKKGENDCWEWKGSRHPISNYGTLYFNGKRDYAHRVAMGIINGSVPKGKHILHHCDNPPCINPAHLYIGTHQDNMRDSAKRNRHTGSVLSLRKANIIRGLHRAGIGIDFISKAFKVSKTSIYRILKDITYQQA